jgi:hypothetical protein
LSSPGRLLPPNDHSTFAPGPTSAHSSSFSFAVHEDRVGWWGVGLGQLLGRTRENRENASGGGRFGMKRMCAI